MLRPFFCWLGRRPPSIPWASGASSAPSSWRKSSSVSAFPTASERRPGGSSRTGRGSRSETMRRLSPLPRHMHSINRAVEVGRPMLKPKTKIQHVFEPAIYVVREMYGRDIGKSTQFPNLKQARRHMRKLIKSPGSCTTEVQLWKNRLLDETLVPNDFGGYHELLPL